MKIIIDILTPKQCMLFSDIARRLEENGHQVLRTTRKYREVNKLLELKGIDAKVVGRHGRRNLADKLKASAQRTLELTSVLEDFKPDVAVSFSSPEMARVSYGLKVPHVCVNDSPHAEAVARLTVPLSERLLTPKMIPKKVWIKYGISPEKIVQYNALDPWVWLKDFQPDETVLEQLGLDTSRPILTFRTEESFAAYLSSKVQKATSVAPIINHVLKNNKDVQIVAVPRYEEQIRVLKRFFRDKIVVSDSMVDGPSLLYYTSIFIGGGGTMTAEALKAYDLLKKEGIEARVIHMPTVKPIDKKAVIKAARETGLIITCEEHSVIGGLGGAVSRAMSEEPVPMRRIGVNDVFGESGEAMELVKKYGLSADNIAKNAKDMLKKKKE